MVIVRRKIQDKLIRWKNDPDRKPLLLQGARQVGKTFLLKEFGKKEFQDIAYFNFEEQVELKQFFENTKDVRRIVQNLSLVHKREILPRRTLIVFDEIQECNAALNSLKYFCENAPEYAVCGAGSLLGVAMSRGNGFPVGKVHFIEVNPIDFSEFLSVEDRHLTEFLEWIAHNRFYGISSTHIPSIFPNMPIARIFPGSTIFGYPFFPNWQRKTKSSFIEKCAVAQERGNMKMP